MSIAMRLMVILLCAAIGYALGIMLVALGGK